MTPAGKQMHIDNPQTYEEALRQKGGKKCIPAPFYRDFFTGNYGEDKEMPVSRLKHQDRQI